MATHLWQHRSQNIHGWIVKNQKNWPLYQRSNVHETTGTKTKLVVPPRTFCIGALAHVQLNVRHKAKVWFTTDFGLQALPVSDSGAAPYTSFSVHSSPSLPSDTLLLVNSVFHLLPSGDYSGPDDDAAARLIRTMQLLLASKKLTQEKKKNVNVHLTHTVWCLKLSKLVHWIHLMSTHKYIKRNRVHIPAQANTSLAHPWKENH